MKSPQSTSHEIMIMLAHANMIALIPGFLLALTSFFVIQIMEDRSLAQKLAFLGFSWGPFLFGCLLLYGYRHHAQRQTITLWRFLLWGATILFNACCVIAAARAITLSAFFIIPILWAAGTFFAAILACIRDLKT